MTDRLHLLPLPVRIISRRLHESAFTDTVEGVQVSYAVSWPGELTPVLPFLLAELAPGGDEAAAWGSFTAVRRSDGQAVGQLGAKGRPHGGWVEIGYGLIPEVWRQGYAAEGVGALVTWLLSQPEVRAVWAETRPDNAASIAVLRRLGFAGAGERRDAGDGRLLRWERRRAGSDSTPADLP